MIDLITDFIPVGAIIQDLADKEYYLVVRSQNRAIQVVKIGQTAQWIERRRFRTWGNRYKPKFYLERTERVA